MIGFYRNNRLSTAAVLFSTLWLSVACNKGDPKEHLQRGVEYFKQGDYEKAKLELKTSSQSDKNTAETYYYLALLDERNHQYKAMRENLLKVVELEPKNTQARLKLGKLLLPFGEPDAALEQAEIILKEASQNLDALALKASVFIRKKKQEEALALINNILQKNPKFIDALSLKALIYSEKGESDKALALVDEALAVDPKNIDLHFFKIQLHAKAQDMPAVLVDYQNLTVLYPENQDYKITLAKLYTQVGKKQEAEALLGELIALAPNITKPRLLLLDFLSDTAPDKVIEHLHQYIAHFKDAPRRLLELATWTITRNHLDEARKILNQVVALEDDSSVGLSAKTLLAKIAFEVHDLKEAERLIGEILQDNSNYNDAKVLQARIFLVSKQYDKAMELLRKVLLNQPELEEALLLLGQTYVATNDQKNASQYFESALKINPINGQALDYLYDKALSEKKIKLAKDMATTAVKYQGNNLAFLEKLASASLLDKDLEGAKIAVQKISELTNPLAVDVARYLKAQIFQAEGECHKAIDLYRALLIKFPGNQDTLDNMASCFEKLNKRNDMIIVLHDLHAKTPDNASISLLLADLLLREKKMSEGVDILTKLIKNNAKVPQAYIILAKLKAAQNDKVAALSAFQEGLNHNPDAIRLSLSLADFYQQQGDNDLAVSIYEGLLARNPNLNGVINSLAVLLTDQYSSAEMLKKAVQLTERFKDSDQAYYRDTYAWALIKQGKVNEGVTILQEVITSLPDVPVFRYHLGVAYANSDNNGSAIAELQQALDLVNKNGNFPEQKETKILLDQLIAKTRGH
ncbi:tetratricopeptide repeat protein [Crenothrix sp.]|uniref:tetratricopeptide repeat protein n=1 Tax=Crenothrix sp. TaxID=3100433 RepID=UPI00374DC603